MIRPATASDASRIAAIYNHYVDHTVVTFEEERVPASEMRKRIETVSAHYPWLVWDEAGDVIGYAYALEWHARAAYRLTVETTVYLDPQHFRRGFGGALYSALLEDLRERGFHCAIGCIALPNESSVTLHEKLGFEKIGVFGEVGRKFGRWIDVGYWQLIL